MDRELARVLVRSVLKHRDPDSEPSDLELHEAALRSLEYSDLHNRLQHFMEHRSEMTDAQFLTLLLTSEDKTVSLVRDALTALVEVVE